jgi:hypothetical protein
MLNVDLLEFEQKKRVDKAIERYERERRGSS